MLGCAHVVMSSGLVGVMVSGLWVDVNSIDMVGDDNRSVGGFACYPVCWYIIPGYASIIILVVLFFPVVM